jgi:hypothetical protein
MTSPPTPVPSHKPGTEEELPRALPQEPVEKPKKPRKSKTPKPEGAAGRQVLLWESLRVASFKNDLATRAIAMLAAVPSSSAKLTSGELKDRAKLAAKKAKAAGEDHSMSRWVATVAPNLVAVRPEHAPLFDAENCVLSAMRSRRNDVFWPWLVSAGLRPADVGEVDSADVPPQVRTTLGEAFLRLSTLPPAKCDPATGAPPAELSESLTKAFFDVVCNALYPGCHGSVAGSFITEEYQLTSVTHHPLQAACAAREEKAPDGVATLKPPLPIKVSKKKPAATPDPAMSFPVFSALVRVLAEPWLQQSGAGTAPRSVSSGAALLNVVETVVFAAAFSDEAMRRYVSTDLGSEGNAGALGQRPSFIRRRINVASADTRAKEADESGGVPRSLSQEPKLTSAEEQQLPAIGGNRREHMPRADSIALDQPSKKASTTGAGGVVQMRRSSNAGLAHTNSLRMSTTIASNANLQRLQRQHSHQQQQQQASLPPIAMRR